MFHVLLFGMFCVFHGLCGSITLEPRYASTIHGNQFIFNCHVKAGVQGLVIFKGEISQATVCAVGGNKGQQTTDSTNYECSHAGENTFILTIRNVSATHLSPWTCQSGGEKSNKVTLDVKYPPTVAIATVDSRSAFVYLLGEKYASLNCSVTAANPFTSNFTWYHGRKVVGRDQIYTIPTVYKSTSGLYRCVADNGITPPGEDSVSLDVHFPPIVQLTPVQPCTGYTVILGEMVVSLNCSVTAANPFPSIFTWYYGGKVVGRDQIYTIPTVYKSTSGLYRCVADNGITPPGEDNVTVDVHYPPSVHIGHSQIVINESEDLTINCTADAHPKVTSLVWSKEGVATTPLYVVFTAGGAAGLLVFVVGVIAILYARRRHRRVRDAAAKAAKDDDNDNTRKDQPDSVPSQDYLEPVAQSTAEDKYTTLTCRPGRDQFYTELSPLQEPQPDSQKTSDAHATISDCFPSAVDNGSHYVTMLPPVVGATSV
ncbi:neuronal growth regulator 1-like isoform X2 [Haliotis asinina]|uniref:neuronal growth regulator 1-like isoform X2 n=1 Tax=Haliotis asinina TaxID=109174 RepID=UPI003531FB5B